MSGRGAARFFAGLVLLLAVVLSSKPTSAGEREDAATVAAVDKILSHDVANANFGEAKKKLRALIDRCKRGCSGPAVARIYVAIGLVAAQIGHAEEAKTAWFDAFSVDPNTTLPGTGVSPAVRQQFDQVQKQWLAANPQPDDSQKAGWVNKQAYELHKAAIAAESASNWAECIEKGKSALTLEENMRARMQLALCESKAGKVVDALRDNAKALETARSKGDAVSQKTIEERVKELVPKLGHIKFDVTPKAIDNLKITFDDKPLPVERLKEAFTVDPGSHTVHAEGNLRSIRYRYHGPVEIPEGGIVTHEVKMAPTGIPIGQRECVEAAETEKQILECLTHDKTPIVVHAGLDFSAYTDTVATHVVTPSAKASVVSPTQGWDAGATYLVDVLTSASPDVIATASRRFHDVRHAATLNGGFKPGNYGVQAFGSYSQERDYISRTLGLAVSGDFYEKQITPSLGYSYTWDTIGRSGTDYDIFGKPFNTHEITLGSTFVLTPVSVFVFGGGVAFESGDQSKPYRYIPLFEPGVTVPVGASVDQVNAARLPTKPLEQLPLDRKRISAAGRYILRTRSNATLRLEERVYTDTWGIKASTTDGRYMMDLSERLRVWPHAHLHVQTGATYYSRVYGGTLNSDGSATIPKFRSTDRELSPMFGITLGGGTRYALTNPTGKFQLAVFSTVDGLFNYYLNTLYIRSRLAVYGTIGVEADFE